MPTIALISTSDTDLLSARSSGCDYIVANPARSSASELNDIVCDADIAIVRMLGAVQDLWEGFNELRGGTTPLVVLGGEQTPNPPLMEQSTIAAGAVHTAHRYLANGGAQNLTSLHAFLADTVLLSGDVFDDPVEIPAWGTLGEPTTREAHPETPRVGVLFYRAQYAAGNTAYVEELVSALNSGEGYGEAIYVSSLREAPEDLLAHLSTFDTLVVTVLASGGRTPQNVAAGGDDDAWDVANLAALNVPIIQGLCLTWGQEAWAASNEGMSPLDVANQVAIPEFDGRIIGPVFSVKEIDTDGLPRYVPIPERCQRLAGLALAHAKLSHIDVADRKIAIVLTAFPTKNARIGNAVGLDTPHSLIRLLRTMREQGYDMGEPGDIPGTGPLEPVDGEHPDTTAGNALIHGLIAAGGQDENWLTQAQIQGQPIKIPAATYKEWLKDVDPELVGLMTTAWGEAPGEVFVDTVTDPDGEIYGAAIRAGNTVLMVQPPRGFGENPIAIYHDPDIAPTHHYLAVYLWLQREFCADAIIHMGKHGNLEWLPGKSIALSSSCGPDATLGNIPLIYPFIVNDPGEGTQAKRRGHACVIDHMVPPMTRAETYGDMMRLEQLLDEYAQVSVLDPAKLAALQTEVWTLVEASKMNHDLGLESKPETDDGFDMLMQQIDGWLCEVKDSQIRDGLHIMGDGLDGDARVDFVLSMLRAEQMFAGQEAAVPGLRTALGLVENGSERRDVDAAEGVARALVVGLDQAEWQTASVSTVVKDTLEHHSKTFDVDAVDIAGVEASLRFACDELVPRLAKVTDEIDHTLKALDGGYIPAGPSGSPLRGLVNVLPTGRNFYSVDPRAIPTKLAWETGRHLAESLVDRYRKDTGEYPTSVGLSVWGTSAMRTSGDDIAEVLALLGVRPVWDNASRRVTGLEIMSLEELGRPRIDVTVRISGFFRDAFPHAVNLIDDAVQRVAELDEPADQNFVRKHVETDVAEHGDRRRATARVFGSKPGTYGAGMLQVIEAGNWRSDEDLAEVYATWGGFAYGRDLGGVAARQDMETAYARIKVAAKNTDTHEHDIADSDDYFQFHGGMIATVRALSGSSPKSYIGDSTRPDSVKTRSLQEETARVFRARVVNPRWMSAMRRHGYKGAFEMAATVDYLFGFDATAGVVHDWMYEKLTEEYVLNAENQEFMRQANPWALGGIIERLQEAVDRGLWENPDADLVQQMRDVYVDIEGDMEERAAGE